MAHHPLRKHRYNIHQGKPVIEVRVKVPQQLFDIRDPAPFRERDLDKGFFQHIVSVAKEIPKRKNFDLHIHVSDKESSEFNEETFRQAIVRYFSYKEDYQLYLLKDFLKKTQFYLFLGLVLLFGCLGLAEHLSSYKGTWSLSVFKEGLIVIGWVSIWKPIELMMYGWFPVYDDVRFYRKFLIAKVDVDFSPSPFAVPENPALL